MTSTVHHFFSVKKCVTEQVAPSRDSEDVGAHLSVHVAMVGCCHGELDKIYAACSSHEVSSGKKVDFIICAGDFQALRGEGDFRCMAVPERYRSLGDFVKYYRGEKRAPYLTLFVGGNHECSDWLAEESYGGFLAPNIYYLGHSGVVVVDGRITVAGISGIFKAHDYWRPYPDRPFHASEAVKHSAYHVRRVEVEKLKAFVRSLQQVRRWICCKESQSFPSSMTLGDTVDASGGASSTKTGRSAGSQVTFPSVDIFVSHDWPAGITKYGDEEQLLRYKPYFREDIRHGALGNPHTLELLRGARPRYWIAAHLHCLFEATVTHEGGGIRGRITASTTPQVVEPRHTKFLALDKPAKGRGFISFIDVPVECGIVKCNDSENRIVHHPLWLEVLRESHSCLPTNDGNWSADTCGLVRVSADQLVGRSVLIPAHTTQRLLKQLGLSPAPLQQAQPISPVGVAAGRGSEQCGSATQRMCVNSAVQLKLSSYSVDVHQSDAGTIVDDMPWVEDSVGGV